MDFFMSEEIKNFFVCFFIFRVPLVFLLDMLLGEPSFIVHPVVLMGRLISFLEKRLRALFPKTPLGERAAGIFLVLCVCLASFLVPVVVLLAFGTAAFCSKNCLFLLPLFLLDVFWGYQAVAARCLCNEALNVCRSVKQSLAFGQSAVARIVGRDTTVLSEEGVIKACVETVAENTTDGIFSPLIAYFIGCSPVAMLYKAINTMDSMIGYKNERYRFFGTAAARLDDAANFFSARVTAVFMIFAAALCRFALVPFSAGQKNWLNVRNAAKVFLRDRYKHESPNSAQTESMMAGILGVQLAGDAVYEGHIEKKPVLGNPIRHIECADIKRSVIIMYTASGTFVAVLTFVSLCLVSKLPC